MKPRNFALIILAIIALWVVSGLVLYNIPDRGTIGDMFGTINSLFSGLAFAAIIYTILLQKNELGLQREELVLTRAELRGQKETMQAQSELLKLQSFEGTFFQMLRLHNELLGSIDLVSGNSSGGGKSFSGRDCFARAWQHYGYTFQSPAESVDFEKRREQINSAYSKLWEKYESEFGHYFRSLYTIIKFVNNSNVENKKNYTNIVRAQLSGQELIILLYNGIYNKDSKFVPLIEKYALLKHVPKERIESNLDYKFYLVSAFGDKYPYETEV